jgi:uncharacterized membrane-anchored protein YitT (DUF2179 family)
MTAAVAPWRPRGGRAGTWLAVLAGLLVLSALAMLPLFLLSHLGFDSLNALVIGLPCGLVGILVARRQPANPLGWLLLVIALCLIVATDGSEYALLRYRLGYQHLPLGGAAIAVNQLWGAGLYLLGLVVLLFPDGRLSSAWWRGALWTYAGLYAFSIVILAVATAQAVIGRPFQVDVNGGLKITDDATGWYGAVTKPLNLLMLLFIVAFIGRQVLSWRRSSGERRQQLKWLASGAVVVVASAVLISSNSAFPATAWKLVTGLAWFGFAALPVSIGVAILKYRLYDIDRIISRTLAYALVTGLLVGVYAGLVLLATQVLGFASTWAVAASTLAAAALFAPVRGKVQRTVDRRFNRARYNADRIVAAFSDQLKDAVDLAAVQDGLVAVASQALEPAHVSVWLRDGPP